MISIILDNRKQLLYSTLLSLILSTVSSLPLLIVFVESSVVSPDLQIEQYDYFRKILPFVAIIVLSVAVVFRQKIRLIFADYLIIIFTIILLLSYQWVLNPASERLFFLLGIIILWFTIRIAIILCPRSSVYWQVFFIILGGIQALMGIQQLYGFESSNHSLFGMTGSFFNPGPYSGYLAMVFPICIYYILHFRNYKRLKKWNITILYNLACICLSLILIVLPAGMSRTAWIAAIASGLWVIWKELRWNKKIYKLWYSQRNRVLKGGTFFFILLIILLGTFFYLKENSANGRLFLWKMDLVTWKSNMLGVGLGGFPVAYGEAQASYFAENNYSAIEEFVAGTPVYAFNEYLQILVEHSIWGLLIKILFISFIFYIGLKNKQVAWIGSFISLLIFCFASYPMQLPVFVIAMIFISNGCLMPISNKKHILFSKKQVSKNFVFATLFLISGSVLLAIFQKDMLTKYQSWEKTQVLYNMKVYEKATQEYINQYDKLKHQAEFLFEYGHSLAKLGKYKESNEILERGTKLSGDPMFWNVMGKNYQKLQNYQEAEKCFKRAVNILPSRLYSYYLLTKLYAEPEYYNKEKIFELGNIILMKEPKVNSSATREMKREIKEIIIDL